jgi:hypothetical protein
VEISSAPWHPPPPSGGGGGVTLVMREGGEGGGTKSLALKVHDVRVSGRFYKAELLQL